jgi:hypothetical protein
MQGLRTDGKPAIPQKSKRKKKQKKCCGSKDIGV